MRRILVLNGPNLNLLGSREPQVYGVDTLPAISAQLQEVAQAASIHVDIEQSNAEHVLVEHVHAAGNNGTNGIIINPAALTHTSISLRDALLAVGLPFIEVHLSNVFAREAFRHHSYFSDIAVGTICGLGAYGYQAALTWMIRHLCKDVA